MWLKKSNYRNGFIWSAVLFLLLAVSFSGYCQTNELTEAELNQPADLTVGELQAIFQELDDSEKKNETLTNDYNELNQKYLTALTEHKTELMKLQQEVKLMEIESQVRAESLMRLESETIWNDIWTFSAGAITGYALNELKNDIFETYDNDDGGIF